jgi:hypothetical protein
VPPLNMAELDALSVLDRVERLVQQAAVAVSAAAAATDDAQT